MPLKHKTKTAGFTLIELVGVIVIIGILAAVGNSLFISVSSQATATTAKAFAAAMETATQNNKIAYTTGNPNAMIINGAGLSICSKAGAESILSTPYPASIIRQRAGTASGCSAPGTEYFWCIATVSSLDGKSTAQHYKVYCAGN